MNKEKKITSKLITIQLMKTNILCKYEPIFTNQLSVTNQTNSHYEYKCTRSETRTHTANWLKHFKCFGAT